MGNRKHKKSRRHRRPHRSGPIHLRSLESLEQLRDRVVETARELARLREAQQMLREQLGSLAAEMPALPPGGSGARIVFPEDPAVLRQKVQAFIEAVDYYLEQDLGTAGPSSAAS
ncbi:hypothetical protein [Rhodothermus profundi]|uniref:Uncharacterized protein n=1 Tax=Rhodothermus profundi TaxID=633813 RepID=A0A1M6Q4T6_9BACT|nr:hypothetical protein [Rhodothermus profundi]SHK15269.1 hypothetical protein SAMN04488087_0464 [Rhodothermus profundi]